MSRSFSNKVQQIREQLNSPCRLKTIYGGLDKWRALIRKCNDRLLLLHYEHGMFSSDFIEYTSPLLSRVM